MSHKSVKRSIDLMRINKHLGELYHRMRFERESTKKENTKLEEGMNFIQDDGKISMYEFTDDLVGNKFWGYISTETHNLYDIYTPTGLVKQAAYRSVDGKKKKSQTRKIRSATGIGKLYFHVIHVSIKLKDEDYGVIITLDRKKSNYIFEFDKKFLDSERKRLGEPLIKLEKISQNAISIKRVIDNSPPKNAIVAKSVDAAINIVDQKFSRKRPRESPSKENMGTLLRTRNYRTRLDDAISMSHKLDKPKKAKLGKTKKAKLDKIKLEESRSVPTMMDIAN